MKRYLIVLILLMSYSTFLTAQVKNFNKDGKQITKFDNLGRAVDAHDGEIAYFGGTYYLYGTSYDCGFEWNNKTAPFCGFKVYTSKDMINWKEKGYLFDAQTPLWQSRCDGKTYGCFRPHVVYNKQNKKYVLWINVYDNVSGYRVFTSNNPIGPFKEVAEPKIAINSSMPAAGLNNGDHDLFIDDDGTAYLAFTNWRTGGTIAIEKLDNNYLSGTGIYLDSITLNRTEAPGLFKRNGIYYVTYSDPNCGYCSGTGTSYKTAKSLMGPWSEGKKISDNSCGGQPSFVSTMKINTETIYLYGSDLWNNSAKNEALANFYWAPLTFADDGSINPIECLQTFAMPRGKMSRTNSAANQIDEFKAICDINNSLQRAQTFTATATGTLSSFGITTLKSGYPDQPLNISFYEVKNGSLNTDKIIKTIIIKPEELGWSAKDKIVSPNIPLVKGKEYFFLLYSNTSKGCYGFAIATIPTIDTESYVATSTNGDKFIQEKKQKLKFHLFIR